MAEGIILAGGYSSRASTNKMMLTINGEPMLFHTIKSIYPFVDKLVIVTGHYHNEIKNSLNKFDKVEVVYNPRYQDGMFTSVISGARHIDDDFFVLPGDCPFIRASTYSALLGGHSLVRVPTYKGETGHPIFFAKSLIKPLLSEDDKNSNLKAFRDKCGYEEIDVDDENILNDIDTISDYEKLTFKLERN